MKTNATVEKYTAVCNGERRHIAEFDASRMRDVYVNSDGVITANGFDANERDFYREYWTIWMGTQEAALDWLRRQRTYCRINYDTPDGWGASLVRQYAIIDLVQYVEGRHFEWGYPITRRIVEFDGTMEGMTAAGDVVYQHYIREFGEPQVPGERINGWCGWWRSGNAYGEGDKVLYLTPVSTTTADDPLNI
jgi:hypothetical protein